MATDSVEAIIAEMRNANTLFQITHERARKWADRLQSAHDALREAHKCVESLEISEDRDADDLLTAYLAGVEQGHADAESRLREAERDARRLDWLLRNGKEVVFFVGGELYCYTWMDDDDRAECRAAIDRAMEGEDG